MTHRPNRPNDQSTKQVNSRSLTKLLFCKKGECDKHLGQVYQNSLTVGFPKLPTSDLVKIYVKIKILFWNVKINVKDFYNGLENSDNFAHFISNKTKICSCSVRCLPSNFREKVINNKLWKINRKKLKIPKLITYVITKTHCKSHWFDDKARRKKLRVRIKKWSRQSSNVIEWPIERSLVPKIQNITLS